MTGSAADSGSGSAHSSGPGSGSVVSGPAGPAGWPRSTQVVSFRETLVGGVRAAAVLPPGDDRTECAIAAESVLLPAHGADPLAACVLQGLVIAVDAGTRTEQGGLAGVVRSGVVHVAGVARFTVRSGEFELFPRVPGDARRMRYRLTLQHPDGAVWYLRGTKLVVNEAGGGLVRRIWDETTMLYVVLGPLGGDPAGPLPAARPAQTAYTGVVQVRLADFARQLMSLRGEPGPSGGLRAVVRLGAAFWSVISEVYLRNASEGPLAPGIEKAFDEQHEGRDRQGSA